MKAKNANPLSFTQKVQDVVRNIPEGQTMTYGEVAAYAGSSGAARAVGNIMKNNYDTSIPCHRVIRVDGKPCGYNRGGSKAKVKLLRSEGVKI